MNHSRLLAIFVPLLLQGEVRTLTLRETIDLALKQNPDVILARLEEQKAAYQVGVARDPFTPKVVVGSGLAYTSGFPMSVEGSAPSILQARWIQSLYNKPKSYEVAAARETARATAFDTAARREEAAFQAAALYLDLEQIDRSAKLAAQQLESAERIGGTLEARIREGRDLPIEGRRNDVRMAQARQRLEELEANRDFLESNLAVILGFPPEDRVRVVPAENANRFAAAATHEASIEAALSNSKELKRIESAMQARGLEIRSARSAWLPQVDIVAQYGLFAKFNNYEEYFQTFERHNGQLGVSLALPILPGGGAKARAAQAEVEVTRLRTQHGAVRNRIVMDTRKTLGDVSRAERATETAKLDLDVSREQLGVLLAQFEEGRAGLREVEQGRIAEAEKWQAFYEAQHTLERARLELLRATGTLIAHVR